MRRWNRKPLAEVLRRSRPSVPSGGRVPQTLPDEEVQGGRAPSGAPVAVEAPSAGESVHPEAMSRLVDRIDSLPSIPLVAERVGAMVHDPRHDAQAIAQVMKGDPALTAKVLRLANSPYFAIPGGVSDVARAISFLGFNTLYQLVLTASVFRMLGSGKDEAARRLFRHSVAVGAAAEALAERIGFEDRAAAFTAGLLHDLGRFAVLHVAPELLERVAEAAARDHLRPRAVEERIGLETHDALGDRLAQRWRFPQRLRAAIRYHHAESLAEREGLPRHLHDIVDIVSLADALCSHYDYALVPDSEPAPLPGEVLDRLNVTEAIVQEGHDRLRRKIERSQILIELLAE